MRLPAIPTGQGIALPPRVRAAIGAAADDEHLTVTQVLAGGNSWNLVRARKQAAKNLRAMGYSLDQIGCYLRRNHSTISYHLKDYRKLSPDEIIASIPEPDLSGEWAI